MLMIWKHRLKLLLDLVVTQTQTQTKRSWKIVAGIAKLEKKRKQAERIDHLDPTTVFKGGISSANNFTLAKSL